jgi:xanthosine utilization system XapX-like protein
MKNIPSHNFNNDLLARRVIRFLLIFQLIALLVGIIFTLTHISLPTLIIAFIALVLFLGVILWLYIRYQTYPVVQEKNKLNKKSSSLEAQILAHTTNIQLTHQERDRLHQAEKEEYSTNLKKLQEKYINDGLKNTHISDANIPGVGPKLKERLISHGLITAHDINPNNFSVEGFGEAKSQAVVNWRNQVYSDFNSNKPRSLLPEITEKITQKYQIHHADNDAQEKKVQENKLKLDKELDDLRPQLNKLDSVKFSNYVWKALSPQGILAGGTAAVLVISLLGLGLSSTVGAIVNSISTATITPTLTLVPTNTNTPTLTLTPTVTNTPTITKTPTVTNKPTETITPTITSTPTDTSTPTITFTPSRTPTLKPTITYTPIPYTPPARTYPLGATAICNDGTYSYSQHRSGTCSRHGGVKQWLVNLP